MKHLQRAFDGQNQWGKYLLTLFVALILGQAIGGIPLFLVIAFNSNQPDNFVQPENITDFSAYGINPSFGLILMVIPFLFTLFLTLTMAQGLHKRNLKAIINGGNAIRWKRMGWGFAVWFVLAFALLVVAILVDKENFEFRFDPYSLVPLVIVSILFIPFQAAAEEVLVRGYLAQGVAGLSKRPWMVVLIPSLLFAMLHIANPEVKEYGFWLMMPQYLIMGVVYAIICVLDDGIELAVGLHAANNVFLSIFVTTEASAIQTPALFLQKNINPVSELWSIVISSVLLILVLAFIFRWDFKVLFQKIKSDVEPGSQLKVEIVPVED